MPQVGVNLVRKVDGRRAGGQLHDVALGRVDEHLVVEQVFPHRFQELGGVGSLALPFQQLPQPGHALFKATLATVGAGPLLVPPVRRHPVFRDTVHLVGFDLHFQRVSAVADNRGMQRLVQVLLGVAM